MQNFRPEFVNQRFLSAFPQIVIDKFPKQVKASAEEEIPTKLQRLKKYLKNIFLRHQ
jgi:hypothetical protein